MHYLNCVVINSCEKSTTSASSRVVAKWGGSHFPLYSKSSDLKILRLIDEEHSPREVNLRGYAEMPPTRWIRRLGPAKGLADAFFRTGWRLEAVEIGSVVVGP
jgi:hypothetical protein